MWRIMFILFFLWFSGVDVLCRRGARLAVVTSVELRLSCFVVHCHRQKTSHAHTSSPSSSSVFSLCLFLFSPPFSALTYFSNSHVTSSPQQHSRHHPKPKLTLPRRILTHSLPVSVAKETRLLASSRPLVYQVIHRALRHLISVARFVIWLLVFLEFWFPVAWGCCCEVDLAVAEIVVRIAGMEWCGCLREVWGGLRWCSGACREVYGEETLSMGRSSWIFWLRGCCFSAAGKRRFGSDLGVFVIRGLLLSFSKDAAMRWSVYAMSVQCNRKNAPTCSETLPDVRRLSVLEVAKFLRCSSR